ncbi:hypothetical protein [Flavobacterium sp.]|uniref:hypothetical protein n=1 Tax=Flavobacterium sp. TaxID=239 RepID=UPI003529938F
MTKPSTSFWIISVLALIWNLMGVNQYIMQAYNTDSFRANFTESQLALIDATPAWATAAFAIAVFAAALGCILLLLRKKWATTLFIISFIAIIVQNIDGFNRYNFSDYNGFSIAMTVMIPLIGLFLIGYAKQAEKKGWIA